MNKVIGYFISRGTEPSSYAGIGLLVAGILHAVSGDVAGGISEAVAGIAAIVIKEKRE